MKDLVPLSETLSIEEVNTLDGLEALEGAWD
jgi:hypothetical protein